MLDAGESQHSPADSGAVTPGNVASSPISSSRTRRYKVRAGRGRSSAAGESFEEGADQGFFLDDEGTSVTTEMLAQLRKAYDIPSSVELSLPRPGFRPSQPGSSEVVIHRQSFEYGLRLPIQPFFAQILSGLGVAPAQLSSMAWRNLAGLYILWKEVLGVEPTIEDVHATFTLTTAPKKPGLYYLRTYTGQPHLVPQVNPNTADKAWTIFGLLSLVIGARQWPRTGRRMWFPINSNGQVCFSKSFFFFFFRFTEFYTCLADLAIAQGNGLVTFFGTPI
ncbi:hypothetical protein OWV82_023479 [Melia azedarach]|uniref:Uncharacterized protein n=1 Tax=Melia azedarach TaxID=155640 RepID=A0ACC1WWJ5_MELAZ|nr:hypothetical protein OWV82_023479 [Melia azedarach]